jgi:acyl-CoA reductase-like NAD-dependent aldehyde dehydrogenase
MTIAQEEIFGPVLSVMEFGHEDEAVALANDVPYGLAATVWTQDVGRAMRFAERIDAGIVWTNCPHHLTWNVPYEGFKVSGLGEDLGHESLNTFTQLKVHYLNFDGERVGWPSR